MPAAATAELTLPGVVVVCTAFGTVFSVVVGVYNFFTQRGKKQGIDEATIVAHGALLLEHGEAIKALRASDAETAQAIAVMKDLHTRAEADGAVRTGLLNETLKVVHEIRGELNARYRIEGGK